MLNKTFWQDVKIWAIRLSKSRTILFNMFVAAMASLEGVYGVLQSFLPGNIYAYITVILTVGNAILRVVTTQSIKDK